MTDRKETSTDIIAEMRGAKTEFPFVYLIGEPDTPEVVDFKTKKIIEPRKINIRRVTVKELADRLEAAHKREAGDAAKLREALKAIGGLCAGLMPTWDGAVGRIKDMAETALAAPPRNCDRFANAEEAWDAYDEWADSYRAQGKTEPFNEVGWLFAPATEKEGGAK